MHGRETPWCYVGSLGRDKALNWGLLSPLLSGEALRVIPYGLLLRNLSSTETGEALIIDKWLLLPVAIEGISVVEIL